MTERVNQRNILAIAAANKRLEALVCDLRTDLSLNQRSLSQVQTELQQVRVQVSSALAKFVGTGPTS